jgi:hypothetical protein
LAGNNATNGFLQIAALDDQTKGGGAIDDEIEIARRRGNDRRDSRATDGRTVDRGMKRNETKRIERIRKSSRSGKVEEE